MAKQAVAILKQVDGLLDQLDSEDLGYELPEEVSAQVSQLKDAVATVADSLQAETGAQEQAGTVSPQTRAPENEYPAETGEESAPPEEEPAEREPPPEKPKNFKEARPEALANLKRRKAKAGAKA